MPPDQAATSSAHASWSAGNSLRPTWGVGPGSTSTNRNPAHEPILWATLAFAVGLWMGKYVSRPPSWWVIATAFFIFAAAYFLRRRTALSSALTLGAFILAGALAIQTHSNTAQESALAWLGNGEPVQITAHVIEEGNVESEGLDSFHQRIDVETEAIENEKALRPVRAGVRLNIYSKARVDDSDEAPASAAERSNAMQLFRYGQRIKFSSALNPPRNYRNPGAFDYAGYLRDQGVIATASVKYGEITILPGFAGSRIRFYLAQMRRSIIYKIHLLWPEQAASLIDAMIIGEKSFIERPTRVNFQRSGTYHMLIVAGLHVGILAMFTMWLFRRLGIGDFNASALTVFLILIYAALTQEGSPVWRAALMLTVYLITRFFYRNRAVMNALGAAALALMVANPNALFGASFQMSFLCVALIAGIAVPFLERTVEPFVRGLRNLDSIAYDRVLPPYIAQFRLDLRLVLDRMSRFWPRPRNRTFLVFTLYGCFRFVQLLVISTVMQLGMALPMAYYFHRATSVAIVANVLAVPLLQLLMPAAVLAISTSYASLWLAKAPAIAAAFALDGIAGTVHWLGGLRIADVRLSTPGVTVVLLSAAAVLVTVVLSHRQRRSALAGVIVLLFGAVCIWEIPSREQIRPGVLEMTAIDVGQGESLLLVMPDERKLLVDAGGLPFWTHSRMDIGEDVVSTYLWARGISHLDAIALTHAHADHMAGFPAVIANFRPRELWLPVGLAPAEIRALLSSAARFNVNVVYHKAGDSFPYGGAQVRVLAPDPDFPVRVAHRNDESLVMKIIYRQTAVLLEADAERGTERLVASQQPEADVLKVAHHGSATSSEPDLLAAVHPRFAVISVGVRNVYKQPRPEVLRRLQQAGVITYRTDTDGATSFYLDGTHVTPQPFLH